MKHTRGYVLLIVLLVLALLAFPMAALMYVAETNAHETHRTEATYNCTAALEGAMSVVKPVAETAMATLGTTATEQTAYNAALYAVCPAPCLTGIPQGLTPSGVSLTSFAMAPTWYDDTQSAAFIRRLGMAVTLEGQVNTTAETCTASGVAMSLTTQSATSCVEGLWHFDEGGGAILTDSGPHGLDGTIMNQGIVATWLPAPDLGSLLLYGGYVDVPDPSSFLAPGARDWSMTAWIRKPTCDLIAGPNPNDLEVIVGSRPNNTGENYFLGVGQVTDRGKAMFGGSTPTGWERTSSLTNVCDGRWHHIAGTRSGTTVKIYVDGVLEDTRISTTMPPSSDPGGPMQFGASQVWDGTTAPRFGGNVDDVGIYSCALSASDIAAMANTCKRSAPLISLGPPTPMCEPGAQPYYNVYVKNVDSVACGPANITIQAPEDGSDATLTLNPGQTATALMSFNVPPGDPPPPFIEAFNAVNDSASPPLSRTAIAECCARKVPDVQLIDTSPVCTAGNTNTYSINVTNNSTAGCGPSSFVPSVNSPYVSLPSPSSLSISPGTTMAFSLQFTVPPSPPTFPFTIEVDVDDGGTTLVANGHDAAACGAQEIPVQQIVAASPPETYCAGFTNHTAFFAQSTCGTTIPGSTYHSQYATCSVLSASQAAVTGSMYCTP